MTETGWYRTESGTILEMDLPLPEGIAQRVVRGEIVRVANAAGDPWPDPQTPPSGVAAERREIERLRALLVEAGIDPDAEPRVDGKPPAVGANKPEWVAYAVSQGIDPQAAEAMTKADLIERYGPKPAA